jgi:protein-S-isoprenylcysteine O-methyltransferase Ste14
MSKAREKGDPSQMKPPQPPSPDHDPSRTSAAAPSGGLWVIGQSLLLAAVAIAAPVWSGQWPKPVSVPLGSAAILYAAWTGLSGVARLGRNRTPRPAPLADSVLVTTGIYAIIRHPLYAAMMAMAVGWAFFWSSGVALIVAGIFMIFLHAKALYEERLLGAKYEDYPNYASRVPRYLPAWPIADHFK